MADYMNIGDLILGRYTVTHLIGDGGQASLAKGIDRDSGQIVAIKRLLATPAQRNYTQELARFQRAGRLRIGHPAVVDPIDCRQEAGRWYMVMPFIDGVTLEQYAYDRGGRLAVDLATAIIREIADGLSAIHQQQIVHRDLKPANVIIDANDHPHIVDMGICRDAQEMTITEGTGLLGTLVWMSPEQFCNPGSVDYRSDLYSLGAIYYHLLTGRMAAQGDDPGAVALSICKDIPPSPRQLDPGIPKHLSDACMVLLAKRPEQRFQDASKFIEAADLADLSSAFCPSCGTQICSKAKYCHRCGAELGASEEDALCLACGAEAGETDACPNCGRQFGHSDHRLLFNGGSLAGKNFRIPEGTYVVGRNELSPRDQYISRRQFRVQCINGSVLLEDVGSTNKTYVSGCSADRLIPLSKGMELGVAGSTATFTSN